MLKEKTLKRFIPVLIIIIHLLLSLPSIADNSCKTKINMSTIPGNSDYSKIVCDGPKVIPKIIASSPTIANGSSIKLWVNSGNHAHPPYTWTISGMGYLLDKNETNSDFEERTLSGPIGGTCGVTYDIVVIVTVTDVCGVSDKITIRNTAGKWNNGAQLNAIIPSSGYAWNCACGAYWGYWGCSTDYSITWYDSNQFNGLEGPLAGNISNVLYLGCTGKVFWVIGTTNTYLSNPCNVDAYDCDDAPYNWGPWSGTISGEYPPIEVDELSSYLQTNYCTGVYKYDTGAGFGGTRICPGDRIGVGAIRGYQWVCQ